jgi:hypothetical protein
MRLCPNHQINDHVFEPNLPNQVDALTDRSQL